MVAFPRGERGAQGSRTGRMLPAHFGSLDDADAISSYGGGEEARIVSPLPPES